MTMTPTSPKTSRIDLRLTDSQRNRIERAASARGMSLTQWAVDRLLTAADEDVERQERMVLSDSSFASFLKALEEPIDPRIEALMGQRTPWD